MKTDILVIGGGASGLMAAYAAASTLVANDKAAQVTVLEKMPRPGRKIMLTGKGRCNFTNVKDWNAFSAHLRTNQNFVRNSFYNFPSVKTVEFFEEYGMPTVVERGDRAFPESYKASDVVDTLVNACSRYGVKVITEAQVASVVREDNGGYEVLCASGAKWSSSKVIIATGGLSYPGTGSTGDGYAWAESLGHTLKPCFPALTALVPKGYKVEPPLSDFKGHIARETRMTEMGETFCGIKLKNIGLKLLVEGVEAQNEFGDIDFTDGGLEGPLGFQLSRKCVKSIINGSKASVVLDLKPGVSLDELKLRVRELYTAISKDPRSANLREKERCRILLGKLMPWDLIPAFRLMHPEILKQDRRGRKLMKAKVELEAIARGLKEWTFEIVGFVGYERAVITAGGVSTDEILPKTMESRVSPGLYFCGELMDVDLDTGGYNLQVAFCTGYLAGESAAKKLL